MRILNVVLESLFIILGGLYFMAALASLKNYKSLHPHWRRQIRFHCQSLQLIHIYKDLVFFSNFIQSKWFILKILGYGDPRCKHENQSVKK